MGRKLTHSQPEEEKHPTKPCWKEMLVVALTGIAVSDQQFEHWLDYVERMP